MLAWSSLGEIRQDDIAGLHQSLLVMVQRINIVATRLLLGTLAYYDTLQLGWPDGTLMVNCLKHLQFLKEIACGGKHFYSGHFSFIMFGLPQLLGQTGKPILRPNYYARWDPRIVKYSPCFHGTGGIIVGATLCAVSVWTQSRGVDGVVVQSSGSGVTHICVRILYLSLPNQNLSLSFLICKRRG